MGRGTRKLSKLDTHSIIFQKPAPMSSEEKQKQKQIEEDQKKRDRVILYRKNTSNAEEELKAMKIKGVPDLHIGSFVRLSAYGAADIPFEDTQKNKTGDLSLDGMIEVLDHLGIRPEEVRIGASNSWYLNIALAKDSIRLKELKQVPSRGMLEVSTWEYDENDRNTGNFYQINSTKSGYDPGDIREHDTFHYTRSRISEFIEFQEKKQKEVYIAPGGVEIIKLIYKDQDLTLKPEEYSDLLTTPKAAKMIGIGAPTLRRYSERNLIRTYKTAGGQNRYKKEDLLELNKILKKRARAHY